MIHNIYGGLDMSYATLKILMCDPHLRGGGQVTYVTRLAKQFTEWDHLVTIGCKPGSILVDRAQQCGCKALPNFTFRGGVRPIAWAHDLREMVRFIKTEQPHILHVSGSQDHWTAALANRILGRPVCLVRTRHNTYSVNNNFPNHILNRRWTDFQIVVCDVVRKDLAKQSAFDSSRMRTIHNGVDAEQFKPDPEKRNKARNEFGYKNDDLVLGISARLVKDKGHEFLFKAMKQLYKVYPNMKALALGQGELEAELKQLVRDLDLADRVQFAGYREDIANCIHAFDIAIQPSIGCDTSSFSMKEAMAAEIPVIASDYGGLKEIVYNGVEGMVVQTASVQPLAAAIRRMMDSEELRKKMGHAGRRRVLQDFTVEIFAKRTIETYRQALEIHREHSAPR